MVKERYTIAEAVSALQTSKSTLYTWMLRADLVEPVKRQRMPDDWREHYLTRAQVEELAAAHRRTLDQAGAPDVQAVDSALSERIERVEGRLSRLEARVNDLQNRTTPAGKGTTKRTRTAGEDVDDLPF